LSVTSDDGIEVGVDIGGGGDLTVCWSRTGMRLERRWFIRSPDAMETTDGIAAFCADVNAGSVKVDTTGIGWAVAGRLRQRAQTQGDPIFGMKVIPANFGSAPDDKDHFVNLRDELYWQIGRGLTMDQTWDLSILTGPGQQHLLPMGEEIMSELTAVQWAPATGGKIKIEPKDNIIRRIGHSPDDADALLLCFWPGRSLAGDAWVEYLRQQAVIEAREQELAAAAPTVGRGAIAASGWQPR
jgi:hypothetical protein